MNNCHHQVSLVSNFLSSEAIPAKCKNCGAMLVRKHPTPEIIGQGVFAFSGIPYLVLLVVLLEYFPLIVSGTALLFLILYAWDVKQKPLFIYTKIVNEKTKKFGIIILLALVTLIAVALIGI